MAKSHDSLFETETTIRWDALDNEAVLWTADPKVRKEWQSWGFPVSGEGGRDGWRCRVPSNRVTYRPFKKTVEKQAQKEGVLESSVR